MYVDADQFIQLMKIDVYPITIVKFLLNKNRIFSFFRKAQEGTVSTYTIGGYCPSCEQKMKELKTLCRQHTSIQRVLNADNVGYDIETECFFYKNEIFRKIGDRLVIVYCPHTKLIMGEITDAKVRKVMPITVEDEKLPKVLKYKNVKEFSSSELFNQRIKCWFNEEFSIVTVPRNSGSSDFCLIPNK